MAQLQHNMWVTNARSSALSIITGGGKWIEMTIPADGLYQHFLVTAERRFWRCVQTGDTPRPYGIEPPRPRIEAVPDGGGSMTMDEQRQALDELNREIESLERAEESLVCAAYERGVDVLRRSSADPQCVLGVRLPPKPVAVRPARRQRLPGPVQSASAAPANAKAAE
jgi:hypothetical protein